MNAFLLELALYTQTPSQMDIDVEEHDFPVIPKLSLNRRPQTVIVDDAHPYDLEAYISSYTGQSIEACCIAIYLIQPLN